MIERLFNVCQSQPHRNRNASSGREALPMVTTSVIETRNRRGTIAAKHSPPTRRPIVGPAGRGAVRDAQAQLVMANTSAMAKDQSSTGAAAAHAPPPSCSWSCLLFRFRRATHHAESDDQAQRATNHAAKTARAACSPRAARSMAKASPVVAVMTSRLASLWS